jgi:hypothetical protein
MIIKNLKIKKRQYVDPSKERKWHSGMTCTFPLELL